LRERHATLQLDSKNATSDRLDTFVDRTGWPPESLEGKLVLECGCGAGPDTEILLSLGARVVAVDIAGVDVARANLAEQENPCLVQASIADLPFKPESFDVVFCHRVIMHTPDPEAVLEHILRFRKPGGSAFAHSYSRDFFQLFRWKYVLRPLTRRMNAETLYRWIENCTSVLYPLTRWMNRNRYLRRIAWIAVPYINHRHHDKYANMDEATMREYSVHETFDALSPRYDNPLSIRAMRGIAERSLDVPFEIFQGRAYVLLRTGAPGGTDDR
jgi:2-polyprenyl-3-methyl-5-hydroxy-6-metoxy-1,4-benzoquinol methylase